MKSLIQTILFTLMLTQIHYPQWTNQNPVPDGNDLWSTFFIDGSTGWIVGSDGFIKKTTNAGIDWIQQISNTNLILKSIQFIDQNTGWICGEQGMILKTSDGGMNWFSLDSRTSENLTDIYFNDFNTGYAVGFGGTILKTTNGGLTWIIQSSDISSDLNDVYFVDTLLGYTVGGEYGSYAILKTTDGGLNWFNMYSGLNLDYEDYLLGVNFIDGKTGFVGGGGQWDNFIYKTTDAGETWIRSTLPCSTRKEQNYRENLDIYYSGGINSIYFKDSNIGYAVGGNGDGWNRQIYTTTDNGSTWVPKYIGWEENGLISVYGNSQGQGWAVGFTGAIFITEDDGNSWAQILSGDKSSNFSGDDIYSVFCINEKIIYAVGKRDRWLPSAGDVILKTTNGGKIWKTQQFFQSSDGPTRSVYFVNENIGWAVGKGIAGFFRTTNGGENWIEGVGLYSSVFFTDQNNGWATNDDYSTGIYKSTNGGITWNQKSSVSSSSIYFSDLNTGWAIGKNGSILKSTDSGETWMNKTSGTTNDLKCVKFYDSILGICVGNEGIILLSNDGGETWTPRGNVTVEDLTSVAFTSSSSVWIAGANGTILNTTDLGISWISYDQVTENDLSSLCFINEFTGWIGGMNGTMFKYQNDVIPVELISFTANVINNTVQLNWQTATEINNSGFEIERASISATPVQEWEKIGFIEGHGNSSSPNSYSFGDRNTVGGSKLKYRLKQVDFDGRYKYSHEVEVEIVPGEFVLYQNYPNPFNPVTKIRYQVTRESKVMITIYDMLGAEVKSLVNEKKEPGYYEVELNGIDLSSGTYIYRMIAGDFVEVKKMVLLR